MLDRANGRRLDDIDQMRSSARLLGGARHGALLEKALEPHGNESDDQHYRENDGGFLHAPAGVRVEVRRGGMGLDCDDIVAIVRVAGVVFYIHRGILRLRDCSGRRRFKLSHWRWLRQRPGGAEGRGT